MLWECYCEHVSSKQVCKTINRLSYMYAPAVMRRFDSRTFVLGCALPSVNAGHTFMLGLLAFACTTGVCHGVSIESMALGAEICIAAQEML